MAKTADWKLATDMGCEPVLTELVLKWLSMETRSLRFTDENERE